MGYVVGTGVALSLALLVHAVMAIRTGPSALLVVLVGFVPALALVGANYWLPQSGLRGAQVWTVAEWSGLGIGLLTLLNLAVLFADVSVATVRSGLLASSVAIGGFVGILVGTLLELRRSRDRLAKSNDVLNRILRHDVRNRLNVMLGHVSELERTTGGEAADQTEQLRQSVEKLVTTTEKARQIDVALNTHQRDQHPVDLVGALEQRLDALERLQLPIVRVVGVDEFGDVLIGDILFREHGVEGPLRDAPLEVRVDEFVSEVDTSASLQVSARTVQPGPDVLAVVEQRPVEVETNRVYHSVVVDERAIKV